MNLRFLLVFVISLLVLPIVLAAPPQTTIISDADKGLIVEVLTAAHVEEGKAHHVNVHVFNETNGIPLGAPQNIGCYADLYNATGDHLDSLAHHLNIQDS